MTLGSPPDNPIPLAPRPPGRVAPTSPGEEEAPIVRMPVSIGFRIAGVSGALFTITAVAWVVAGMGDQRHPLKTWLGRHGVTLIAIEAVAMLGGTVLGMFLPEPAPERGQTDPPSPPPAAS